MRQSIIASLLALCCLGCPSCNDVDVYGTLLRATDAGAPDSGSNQAAQDTDSLEPPPATPHTSESKPAVLPSTTGETNVSALDAGAMSAVTAPADSEDILCLRGLTQDDACKSARTLAFGRAVCSCGDIAGPGILSTQSSDSGAGRADVGADGSLSLRIGRRGAIDDAAAAIDGSVVISGPGPSAISGSDVSIGGDVSIAGELAFAGTVQVAGSLSSRRVPRGSGALSVAGDLHYATDRLPIDLPSNLQVAGSIVEGDYAVPAPCECNPVDLAELPRAIAAAESSNDNALAQLTPDAMSGLTSDRSFELHCGHYYFDSVSSLAQLHWQISGHVVVHVAGDFAVRGELDVVLAPSAELDVLIGGSLLLASSASFGDPARAGASRIYVQAAVELATDLPGPSVAATDMTIVGNLYAPAASLQLAPNSEVYGSLFVRQLLVLQSLLVHYDPSVRSERGGECEK